jgi:hypothetical protein
MGFKAFVLTVAAGLMLAAPTPALAQHDEHPPALAAAEAPVRQLVKVWFTRPTQIGHNILQGQYIIEHDTDRMARGEPCTHIYAANNRRVPVVTFHCTHLEKSSNVAPTVTIVSTGDPGGVVRLTEFQFSGETAAHGVPSVR